MDMKHLFSNDTRFNLVRETFEEGGGSGEAP